MEINPVGRPITPVDPRSGRPTTPVDPSVMRSTGIPFQITHSLASYTHVCSGAMTADMRLLEDLGISDMIPAVIDIERLEKNAGRDTKLRLEPGFPHEWKTIYDVVIALDNARIKAGFQLDP